MGQYQVARSRLERAKEHGERLAQLWNDIPTNYLLTPKAIITPDGDGVLFAQNVGAIPESLSLLFGEMLYQLRAALDASVYQAAIQITVSDPPPDVRSYEFPITENPSEWKKLAKRRLSKFPQAMQDGIFKIQPFNTPKLLGQELIMNMNRALGTLNAWASKDRHRTLHIVGSSPISIDPRFDLPQGVTLDSLEVAPPSVIREGALLANFHLKGFAGGMRFPMNPQMRTNFGCDEPPPPCHPSDTLDRRLVGMLNTVHSVISAFEKHI